VTGEWAFNSQFVHRESVGLAGSLSVLSSVQYAVSTINFAIQTPVQTSD